MIREYIRFVLWSLVLLFLQVSVMNHIRLFGYCVPIIYLYPLLVLPYQVPRWLLTLLGSLIGLALDMAMNTPGLNMASAALVGFVRTPILYRLTDPQELENLSTPLSPSIFVVQVSRYFLYFLIMLLIHIGSLFLLEAFSSRLFGQMLPYIIGSTFVTLLLLFIAEALSRRNRSV